MKKKILTFFMALMLVVTGVLGQVPTVQASDIVDQDVPLQEILTENAIVGHSENNTWGVYYLDGISIINDSGGGKIGWGGSTYAARTCKVSITCIVERYSGGSWVRVTSATTTTQSGLLASVSKITPVASGYYYRVRSSHYAATDVSSSSTYALLM